MGVDYTAFACYGVRLKCTERDADKIDEAIPRKLRVGYAEWGSRCYGGDFGFVLVYGDTYSDVDMRGGNAGVRMLSGVDTGLAGAAFEGALSAIRSAGIECSFDGEPGWMVGGHIW